MTNPMTSTWTFHGPLEDSTQGVAEALPSLEDLRIALYRGGKRANGFLTLDEMISSNHFEHYASALSHARRARFWYRVGRAYLHESNFHEALNAFGCCAEFLDRADGASFVPLLRYRASAAFKAHRYEEAIAFFDELRSLWEALMDSGKASSCIEEDACAFLCNILRQLAQCWLYRGSPIIARTLLERYALPLVEQHFSEQGTPVYLPAANSSEGNWRELWVFVPWVLNMVVSWQVRFAQDPADLDTDLHRAYAGVMRAARLSQIMPEVRLWAPSLYTSAAETMILRCRLSAPQELRQVTFRQARDNMRQARKVWQQLDLEEPDTLRELVLQLPEYELELCERRATDTFSQAGDLLERVGALRDKASNNLDPSSQLLAARCAWSMGTIEAEYAERAGSTENTAMARSRAYLFYLQALGLLPGDTDEASLNERGIHADMERLSFAR